MAIIFIFESAVVRLFTESLLSRRVLRSNFFTSIYLLFSNKIMFLLSKVVRTNLFIQYCLTFSRNSHKCIYRNEFCFTMRKLCSSRRSLLAEVSHDDAKMIAGKSRRFNRCWYHNALCTNRLRAVSFFFLAKILHAKPKHTSRSNLKRFINRTLHFLYIW